MPAVIVLAARSDILTPVVFSVKVGTGGEWTARQRAMCGERATLDQLIILDDVRKEYGRCRRLGGQFVFMAGCF